MPLTCLLNSRTNTPLKIKLKPPEISELSMEHNATKAIAPLGVFARLASQRIPRFTSGADATTYPPTMVNAICIVNGTSAQKFIPPVTASWPGFSPIAIPMQNTHTIPRRAKINGSGNQRSLHAARSSPSRLGILRSSGSSVPRRLLSSGASVIDPSWLLFTPVFWRGVHATLKKLLNYAEVPGISLINFTEGSNGLFLRVWRINRISIHLTQDFSFHK